MNPPLTSGLGVHTLHCFVHKHKTQSKYSWFKTITSNGFCWFPFIYMDVMWHSCIWLLFHGKLIPVMGSIMTRKYIKTSKSLTYYLVVNFPVATSPFCVLILSWPFIFPFNTALYLLHYYYSRIYFHFPCNCFVSSYKYCLTLHFVSTALWSFLLQRTSLVSLL
jgi:hypothetical protein